MKRFFYPRLAFTNIRKNAKIYVPYLLASSFTVMMFYLIHSLSSNPGLKELKTGSATMQSILNLGIYVVLIFAVIFLFYINSFIIKRRKKEVALYNILGMEKKHVMIMMLCETLFTTFISLVGGMLLGILFSKVMFLMLVKLVGISTTLTFGLSLHSITNTILFFVPIFVVSYLFNVIQIKMANPIELLRGGQTGEKEPRTKWILTLIGVLSLGSGYYLAQTIEDPAAAMLLFFVAVILVIIGTYSLFTAGSIMILKMLKKNKRFYYQTRHFTSVSQLVYRMKQNAVGLASICILCTCILVMLSTTVSLYSGVQDSVSLMLDESFQLKFYLDEDIKYPNDQQLDKLYADIKQELKDHQIEYDEFIAKRALTSNVSYKSPTHIQTLTGYSSENFYLTGMSIDEYNKTYQQDVSLKDNEILIASNFFTPEKEMKIDEQTFKVKQVIEQPYLLTNSHRTTAPSIAIVFSNVETLEKVVTGDMSGKYANYVETLSIKYKDGTQEAKADEVLKDCIQKNVNDSKEEAHYYMESHYSVESMFTEMYGSLFFLGIFLGTLFLMAAILIMYYKQLSEGFEDQKRFEIMQNVGMSKKEVKQTIRSQVLIFFFLPLVVAVIHMAFAFKMIVNMLGFLVLSGASIFLTCTVVSVIVLAIIYSVVYSLTARTYYKIVKH